MFINKKVTFIIFILMMFANILLSAPLSGSYNVGAGQTYTTLTGAGGFFNAVNVNGLSGNVTVNIVSNITETGAVALNQWTGSNTILIQSSAAVLRTLSGNVAIPLIGLNGADRVTFDGRVGGTGRYLRFVNNNTGGQTFRFINDATLNTITYCIVDGMRVSPTSGIIDFSTTTGTTGNDNNTVSFCTMKDASGGTLQNAIVSNGTTTAGLYNSNITITNNEIVDVYRNAANCSAILLLNGSTDFTITNNSIYQTSTKTPAAVTVWTMINVNTSIANNITISNNFLGGTAANCGGTAWTFNGTQSNALYFIRFQTAGTTTASNVNGNTIANISFTATPATAGVTYFAGIIVESGLVNVGTTSGNIIGNTSSTGNITLTYNGTTDNIINRAIVHSGSGNISNNTMGSISIAGVNNRTIRLECLMYSGTPTSNITISNNTIGSTTTSNSIQQTSSTFAFQLTGIHTQVNTILATVSGNTLSNFRVTSNSANSRIRGIYQARGTTASISFANNVISNMYCASSSTDRYPDNTSLIGLFTGSSSATQNISGNTITGLYGTGNSDSYVMGFGFYNNVAKGTFERNRISNLNHSSTSGLAKVWGINAFWGSWNIYNNQISITNGEPSDSFQPVNEPPQQNRIESVVNNDGFDITEVTKGYYKDPPAQLNIDRNKEKNGDLDVSTNGIEIKGIHDEAEFPCLYYYNSIYIGGTQGSGSANSWAYDRPLLTWATNASLRNNLFYNARTGGTGSHYAMGNEVGYANWTGTSSDYNVFVASNSSRIAIWGSTNLTIQTWRDSSIGDKHAWSTTSGVILPTNLFTNVSTGDLSIKTGNFEAWIVSGKGIAIAGSNNDYDGNTRPTAVTGGCTDIGSDEFVATPPNNPLATASNAPGSGVTSDYSLWGRVLLTVNWGTGGTSYPSALNVRYYSGVNPSGVLGGGYSNSYWQVNPVGTLTGATYDITINFGQNEIYTISTPSANTRLAKYNTTWEVFTIAGTGNWQSDLNYTNEVITTRGMWSFSDYALTDGTNPLPVEICSFTASVNNRQADLNWETCSEVNNSGFDIERRSYDNNSKAYNNWQKISFVTGHGTTNEHNQYRFADAKLTTGKYQYRLKQIDFNSNYEYHNLNTPTDVIIGTPIAADLFQNYPNPSNPTSKVDFQIPFSSKVSLKVFDIAGKEVASIMDKELDGGFYTAEFNGSNLASGVYFYRLIASSADGNKFTKTMKLILVK
ncbi:MAG: T9SS type A sorting domain-containing protein [Ignavibacteria bacterium]